MQWKVETNEQAFERLKNWKPFFAWLPVMLHDGTVIWLQMLERRYITRYAYSDGMIGWWEYAIPETPEYDRDDVTKYYECRSAVRTCNRPPVENPAPFLIGVVAALVLAGWLLFG